MEKDRLLKLVEAYQEHFKQYNRPDYNETEVRNDFVNPFFEILGWDVQNKKNLPQHLREVKHEASYQCIRLARTRQNMTDLLMS